MTKGQQDELVAARKKRAQHVRILEWQLSRKDCGVGLVALSKWDWGGK